MKNIVKQTALLLSMLFISSGIMAQENTQFKSAEEAANKGKQDLLEVLKSGRDLNLGVTADQLERSKPGKLVMRKMLSFEKLLDLSNAQSLDEIIAPMVSGASIVPFMLDGKVVTVIQVAEADGSWKLVGLAGEVLSKELTMVMQSSGSSEVIIYEVPNLRTQVYAVKKDGREVYYTNYQGNSLRQPIAQAKLFDMLQTDAKSFQAEFGDKIKEQRLVR